MSFPERRQHCVQRARQLRSPHLVNTNFGQHNPESSHLAQLSSKRLLERFAFPRVAAVIARLFQVRQLCGHPQRLRRRLGLLAAERRSQARLGRRRALRYADELLDAPAERVAIVKLRGVSFGPSTVDAGALLVVGARVDDDEDLLTIVMMMPMVFVMMSSLMVLLMVL